MQPYQLAKIVNQRLELVPETLAHIRQFPSNIKWVGVIGQARSGKSFLSKHFSGHNFHVSPEIQPCTYGVWISQPQEQSNGEYVVYVDSEGTDMGDTSQQHRILAIVCLLLWDGGVLIDNETNYSHTSLNALTLLASTLQIIRGIDGSGWPFLCFLLRNFNTNTPLLCNGTQITTDEFLEYFLREKKDGRDEDRRVIRESFQKRMLHLVPAPRDEDLSANQLVDGNFKMALDALKNKVLSVATIKKIGGVPCDGAMLVKFLEDCVQNINERGNITMRSAIEGVTDSVCSRFAEEMLASYKNNMQSTLNNLTGDDQPLQTAHNNASQAAITRYNQSTEGVYPGSVEKSLQWLQQKIDADYDMAIANNRAVREQKARETAEAARAREEQARIQAEEEAKRLHKKRTSLNGHGFIWKGKRVW